MDDCGMRISDCGLVNRNTRDVADEVLFVFFMIMFDSINELSDSIRDESSICNKRTPGGMVNPRSQ